MAYQGTKAMGDTGEELAVEYLSANGFNVMHRNWRVGRYEIDITATKDGILHIIEVKTRRKDGLTSPETAMTNKKHNFLVHAANAYITTYNFTLEAQIDLICIEMQNGSGRVKYYPDVMRMAW